MSRDYPSAPDMRDFAPGPQSQSQNFQPPMAGAYPSHPPTSGAAPYQNSGYPNQTGAPPFQNSPYPTQANSGAPPYSVHGANTATPYPPMPHAYQQTNPYSPQNCYQPNPPQIQGQYHHGEDPTHNQNQFQSQHHPQNYNQPIQYKKRKGLEEQIAGGISSLMGGGSQKSSHFGGQPQMHQNYGGQQKQKSGFEEKIASGISSLMGGGSKQQNVYGGQQHAGQYGGQQYGGQQYGNQPSNSGSSSSGIPPGLLEKGAALGMGLLAAKSHKKGYKNQMKYDMGMNVAKKFFK